MVGGGGGIDNMSDGRTIRAMYEAMLGSLGHQHWWPAETRIEMIVGAILAQNTAWTNVERAIANLKEAGKLTVGSLVSIDQETLAELIRPAGTFRVKAKRLKAFLDWLDATHGGDLDRMFATNHVTLRRELLGISGIGPETADCILLYAGSVPTFVVDAYTKRILRRHFLADDDSTYDVVKETFESNLPTDTAIFGEYHALLVEVGKRYCRPKAKCDSCPLREFEHDAER